MDSEVRNVLTIAGFDPSGGAGIIADIRACTAVGVYGLGVITALTVQDTHGVASLNPVDHSLVADQLDLLLSDIRVDCAKTGILPTSEMVAAVAGRLSRIGKLVIDPVFASTAGAALADKTAFNAVIEKLIPSCELVTPNIHEAEVISGIAVRSVDDAIEAAAAIRTLGAQSVCVTGGHWTGAPVDIFLDGNEARLFRTSARRIERELHGTGCTFSALAAACLAGGATSAEAVEYANRHTSAAIVKAVQPGAGMAVPWPRPA